MQEKHKEKTEADKKAKQGDIDSRDIKVLHLAGQLNPFSIK